MSKILRKLLGESGIPLKIPPVSRRDKQIEKLGNPASDNNWTLNEVLSLLAAFGFTETGGRGSHKVFTSPGFTVPVVLAVHGGKIKSGYIRDLRTLLLNQ